jgi:hypothetical protein
LTPRHEPGVWLGLTESSREPLTTDNVLRASRLVGTNRSTLAPAVGSHESLGISGSRGTVPPRERGVLAAEDAGRIGFDLPEHGFDAAGWEIAVVVPAAVAIGQYRLQSWVLAVYRSWATRTLDHSVRLVCQRGRHSTMVTELPRTGFRSDLVSQVGWDLGLAVFPDLGDVGLRRRGRPTTLRRQLAVPAHDRGTSGSRWARHGPAVEASTGSEGQRRPVHKGGLLHDHEPTDAPLRGWARLPPRDDRDGYRGAMSAQPTSDQGPHGPYEVIHLGGEAAAIVPLSELRRLRAVERRASAEVLEEAEIEATLAAHHEWVAAGRPGAVSHEEAMAELLGQ